MPTQWLLYDLYIYLHDGQIKHHPEGRGHGYAYPVTQTPKMIMDGATYRSESYVIVCNKCGEVWARRVALDREDIDNWQVKRIPCRIHGNGSLWSDWNEPWNRSLPYELLLRELDLMKQWYDLGVRTHLQFWKYKHYGRF
jgi:hypothetical protein